MRPWSEVSVVESISVELLSRTCRCFSAARTALSNSDGAIGPTTNVLIFVPLDRCTILLCLHVAITTTCGRRWTSGPERTCWMVLLFATFGTC